MAESTCGYCLKATHLTVRWGSKVPAVRAGEFTGAQILQGAFTCDNCHRLNIAYYIHSNPNSIDGNVVDAYIAAADSEVRWVPKVGAAPTIVDVPEHIAIAAMEAHACASIGANMAAILMARTVIEASAKAKGITTGLLIQKIEAMKDANLIRPDIALVAHEIRHAGNDMAHGDIDDARPEAIDAEDMLTLMMQVLAEVFQGPALLQRVQARRTGAAPGVEA